MKRRRLKRSALLLALTLLGMLSCCTSETSSDPVALARLHTAAKEILDLKGFRFVIRAPHKPGFAAAVFIAPNRLLVVASDRSQVRVIGDQEYFEIPNRRGFFFKKKTPVRGTIGRFLAPLEAARDAASVVTGDHGRHDFTLHSVAVLPRGRSETSR